jgi:hypothetical protein
MIYLLQNQTNTVILELTQNSNLLTPSYLFEFINDITPTNIVYFTTPDLSSYCSRYNKFEVTLTGNTSTNLTGGTININPGGYTYNIYEATGLTLNNLVVSATTGCIVQTGIAVINGDNPSLASIYQ